MARESKRKVPQRKKWKREVGQGRYRAPAPLELCGVYQIINNVTGWVYIGSSVNIFRRWKQHRQTLQRGAHAKPQMQRDADLHGWHSFTYELLEICADQEEAWEREDEWIRICVTKGVRVYNSVTLRGVKIQRGADGWPYFLNEEDDLYP